MARCRQCGQYKGTKKHTCLTAPWNKGVPWSEEVKIKISESKKGNCGGKNHPMYKKKHTEKSKLKNSLSHLGKKRSLESRRKQGLAIKGEKSYLWKGGITPINKAIRNSPYYKDWRSAVFKRDNYTCQNCREVGGILNADHIKPFSLYPKLRFDMNNGRTLCKPCHKQIGWELFREANPMKEVQRGYISN